MSKTSKSGGKYTGNHTTLIDLAFDVCNIANKCPEVKRISPGFITSGLPSVAGQRRVKITFEADYILLSIRGNTSFQEVHVYVWNLQPALEWIARGIRNHGVAICFDARNKKR